MPRTTVNGQTLEDRVWSLLRSAYTAAGIDPGLLVVTQGSYKAGGGASASGSTHDGGGAFDLRTWNLPKAAQADLCRTLVVELRRRNVCAWYRDDTHGGMDPHIHGIVRDEAGLSSGAAQQVRDYDRALNGLSNKGPDYHPRPTQKPYKPTGDDMPLTNDEIERIAQKVWAVMKTDPVNDQPASTASLLMRARRDAYRAAYPTATMAEVGIGDDGNPVIEE